MRLTISGIDLRTVKGIKGENDLRLEAWTRSGWRPVEMALPLAMVDFFTENEQSLTNERSYWKFNGETYFLRKVRDAVRDGWRTVAIEIETQRRGRGAA